ncbi:hypothetical protein N7523_004400 [Penicillium sp. IBT 18751x]|nr:hypothetical protein N7523_004400 [Penicillium sp. IBT 18751x]
MSLEIMLADGPAIDPTVDTGTFCTGPEETGIEASPMEDDTVGGRLDDGAGVHDEEGGGASEGPGATETHGIQLDVTGGTGANEGAETTTGAVSDGSEAAIEIGTGTEDAIGATEGTGTTTSGVSVGAGAMLGADGTTRGVGLTGMEGVIAGKLGTGEVINMGQKPHDQVQGRLLVRLLVQTPDRTRR